MGRPEGSYIVCKATNHTAPNVGPGNLLWKRATQVGRARNPTTRGGTFTSGDEVKMKITEIKPDGRTRMYYKTFDIFESRLVSDHYEYQLTDPNTNASWEGGKW